MTRPVNIPETATLNEFNMWVVRLSGDYYDIEHIYNQDGDLVMVLEMEV